MKNFIYVEKKYPNRKRDNRECVVYGLSDNKALYLLTIKYSTAATRGAKSEVFNALMEKGYIPKEYYSSSVSASTGAGYFEGKVTEIYSIEEVG